MNSVLVRSLFTLALILYGYGVIQGMRKDVNAGVVGSLLAGFVVDLSTTFLVMAPVLGGGAPRLENPASFLVTVHRMFGGLGLVGMLMVLILAAVAWRGGRTRRAFRVLALIAYPIWVISFIIGLPAV